MRSITKHPYDENSLLGIEKKRIYHLNLATQTYTELEMEPQAEFKDLEWVTTSNDSFLVVSNEKADCLQSMNLVSLTVVEYLGQCGTASLTTNTEFENTILENPNQLGFDENNELLYVSVNHGSVHHLIRCDLKQRTTTEISVSLDSTPGLPSSAEFHFSYTFENTLIVSENVTKRVFLLIITSLSSHDVQSRNGLPLGVTDVAYIADMPLGVWDGKVWTNGAGELCLTPSCFHLTDVKFLKQLSPYRIAVYENSNHLRVVGVDILESASTTASTTARTAASTAASTTARTTARTTASTTTLVTTPPLPRHNPKGHCQLNILQRDGLCKGEYVSNVISSSSLELCGYMCIKNVYCQALAYDVITNHCHLFSSLEGVVDMDNVECYTIYKV